MNIALHCLAKYPGPLSLRFGQTGSHNGIDPDLWRQIQPILDSIRGTFALAGPDGKNLGSIKRDSEQSKTATLNVSYSEVSAHVPIQFNLQTGDIVSIDGRPPLSKEALEHAVQAANGFFRAFMTDNQYQVVDTEALKTILWLFSIPNVAKTELSGHIHLRYKALGFKESQVLTKITPQKGGQELKIAILPVSPQDRFFPIILNSKTGRIISMAGNTQLDGKGYLAGKIITDGIFNEFLRLYANELATAKLYQS